MQNFKKWTKLKINPWLVRIKWIDAKTGTMCLFVFRYILDNLQTMTGAEQHVQYRSRVEE